MYNKQIKHEVRECLSVKSQQDLCYDNDVS